MFIFKVSHFSKLNLCRIILFNIAKNTNIIVFDKVDSNTLAPITPRTTNSMNIQFTIVWKIVVDNKRDLRNVQPTSPNISADQNSTKIKKARNCFMIASRSFCSISACIQQTVKLASRILSANQST
uniref:Candidate secreted effector n=1 Tax=Meloidogyne incognita TaxID=6306 RepID=A0A914NDG4_MELIC